DETRRTPAAADPYTCPRRHAPAPLREVVSRARERQFSRRHPSGRGVNTPQIVMLSHALIHDYLDAAAHGTDENGALFRPIRNNRTGRLERAITGDGIYRLVRAYSALLGFEIGAHALRATAGTNALDHHADIAKVQEWLGHGNIA